MGRTYAFKAVLLDRDKIGMCPERDERIDNLANQNEISLIWQRPTHEGFLLHHVVGCQSQLPYSPADATTKLIAQWPDYRKGIPATYLRKKIGSEELEQACSVEPDLNAFLERIRYFS